MSKVKKIILLLCTIFFIFFIFLLIKGAHSFSVVVNPNPNSLVKSLKKDERWDILILGMRGRTAPHGGMLTDSIIVFSYKKRDKKGALISIPRDLWVEIPGVGEKRINYAYVAGEMERKGKGIELAKKVVSNVTGLDIDFAIVGDVEALKEIVDILGGIDVYEERSFFVRFYGHKAWIHPGINHLSGSEVLAYVGNRSIDSDFGRMRRQQKVLQAIKEKAIAINLLKKPDKLFEIFNTISKHIQTDIPLSEMPEFLKTISSLKLEQLETLVIDTSNYLYSTRGYNGAYILLPKKGDFSEIQEACKNILEKSSQENSKFPSSF